MILVADSNIVFSALMRDGLTRRILFDPRLELIVPSYFWEEWKRHLDTLCNRSGLSETELRQASSILSSRIATVKAEVYGEFIEAAKKITPDPDDADFFALALTRRCPVWSEDKALKRQNYVRVLRTLEIAHMLTIK